MMNWKPCEGNRWLHKLRQCPNICLESLNKTIKTSGRIAGLRDVTNTKQECSLSNVISCDWQLFKKASPRLNEYRSQQPIVSSILGSSEQLRTWLTEQ